jgi:hypothetical protein
MAAGTNSLVFVSDRLQSFHFLGGILPGLANIMGQAIAKIDKEIDDSIMRPTLRVK